MIKNLLLAGLGGFLGTITRASIYLIFKPLSSIYLTLGINILGSFLIGLLIGYWGQNTGGQQEAWKSFLAIGICGGFTTFSTFSIENLQLFQEGRYSTVLIYTISSVSLGFLAAFGGFKTSNI